MIKLGKKSKLGLGMMIAGGAVMTMGAMVFKQGRKIDKDMDIFEEMYSEEAILETEGEDVECAMPFSFEKEEECYAKEPVETVDTETEAVDDSVEYNPNADHKVMTQAELEAHSSLATF